MVRACLIDVYDTIVISHWPARLRDLAAVAGVAAGDWQEAWLKTRTERDRGKLSVADSFAQTLLACGIEPEPGLVADLARKDAELMRKQVRVFGDTVPFLTRLRADGTAIALVSNCGDTTRALLDDLGVIALADSVVLSCEVGSVKPSPEIYRTALEDLGVAAADAVMIDDQPGFCAGAEAVGVRAIQILRPELDGQVPRSAFPVVGSLLDVPPLL
jgi:HAD superfamily hydrolase (TIGR01509 family)